MSDDRDLAGEDLADIGSADSDSVDGDSADYQAGDLVTGRYRIVELRGRGGMGTVYHAEDLTLRQSVALKLLHLEIGENPQTLERFLSEARIARQISHPNVCRVYDVGEIDNRVFLSMELVDGEDLAVLLKRLGKLASPKVVEIGLEIALGLDAIHQKEIVHRDLKPSNLMLDGEGRIRITDFGIAEVENAIESIEIGLGTPAYMAPEQISGEGVSLRSDLYALGLVLYELVTGRSAFVAESLAELFEIREKDVIPPGALVDDLDPTLERVILRCLSRDPRQRPSTASAVAALLRGDSSLPNGRLARALMVVHREGFENFSKEPGRIAHSVVDLLEQHGGVAVRGGLAGEQALVIFDLPSSAIHHALAEQVVLARLDAEQDVTLNGRIGIAFGEIEILRQSSPRATGTEVEVEGPALQLAQRLAALAMPGQILLDRGAYELARQRTTEAPGEDEGLAWLAHGDFNLAGDDSPVAVFEVGATATAPLVAPPESAAGAPLRGADEILGWRPAVGLGTPHRGSWKLERKLGEGGFGEVWLARHMKTLEGRVFKFCFEASRLRALQREITLFRLLKEELGEPPHPGIARVLDWNFDEAPYFLEVEHTSGGDLEEWAKGEGGLPSIPLAERLEIIAQVGAALQAAHSVGVLHKDVKPSNVLMARSKDGQVRAKLTDFGIGAVIERERLEQAGITVMGLTERTVEEWASSYMGTRLYMAPEVLEGKRATIQADIYALGVMLYQVVVGDFSRALAPGWEREVNDEILREDIALAVDGEPERRLASIAALIEPLRDLPRRRQERELAKRHHAAAEATRGELEQARARRPWTIAVLILATLLAAAGLYSTQRIARDKAQVEQLNRRMSDYLKLSVANGFLSRDPTLAGLLLAEIEEPDLQSRVIALLREVLLQPVVAAEIEHDRPVSAVLFGPRGEGLLAVTWTTATWHRLDAPGESRTLELDGDLSGFDLSPDGHFAIFATGENTAQLWPLASQQPQKLLHGSPVRVARFVPGNSFILTGADSGDVDVWDRENLDRVRTLSHEGAITELKVASASGHVLTVSGSRHVHVWTLAGDALGNLEYEAPILAAAIDPDGERVVFTSEDGTVQLWDLDAGTVVELHRVSDNFLLYTAAFDATGRRVAIGELDDVHLWQLQEDLTWGEHKVLAGHRSTITSLGFDASGNRLLSTAYGGTARLWFLGDLDLPLPDTVPSQVLRGHEDSVSNAAFHPDGKRFATASRDRKVRLWQMAEGHNVRQNGRPILRFQTSSEGGRQVTISWGKRAKLHVFDEDQWEVRDLGEGIGAAAFVPGSGALATVGDRGGVFSWSAEGELVARHQAARDSPFVAIAFNPRSHRMATAAENGVVYYWRSDGSVEVLGAHEDSVMDLAFHSSGNLLASASLDGTARLWDLGNPGAFQSLPSTQAVFQVAFDPNGEYLASASGDETVRVWDLRDGRQHRLLEHPGVGGVLSLAYDLKGTRILSGTDSGDLWIWPNPQDGAPTVLKGHETAIWGVSVQPDGERVLSADKHGLIRSWLLEPRALAPALGQATDLCVPVALRVELLLEGREAAEARHRACRDRLQ